MTSQNEVVAFLSDPANYTDGCTYVDMIKTHGAIVFLGKRDVYKIKQPVSYDYMDFSSLSRRREACEHEIELNKPVAPKIYQDVVHITLEADGRMALNGEGEIVEYAVHMHRFPEECILNNIAENDTFSDGLAKELGVKLAHYHMRLMPVFDVTKTRSVHNVADELNTAFGEFGSLSILGRVAFQNCSQRLSTALVSVLDQRRQNGMVRRCHGDLHLKNIVLLDRIPTPFDALEFDDTLATCDVIYDFSFLIMDMLHKNLKCEANVTFNQYASAAWNLMKDDGFRALPLFLGLRAGIRAMVTMQMAMRDTQYTEALEVEAERYILQANHFMQPEQPRLIAVGGLSGTGKSTLAKALAPDTGAAPGALVLRSDVERKKLFGIEELALLPEEAYQASVSDKVYETLLEKAEIALSQGHSVILDAVHARRVERDQASALAQKLDVPFCGLWLDAPSDVLIARVTARKIDASDADASIVRLQMDRHKNVADDLGSSWRALDASRSPQKIIISALSILNQD